MAQELDFEDKVYKLQKDFPSVTSSEITQYLTASDGVYDTAFALVLQSVDDEQAQVSLFVFPDCTVWLLRYCVLYSTCVTCQVCEMSTGLTLLQCLHPPYGCSHSVFTSAIAAHVQ